MPWLRKVTHHSIIISAYSCYTKWHVPFTLLACTISMPLFLFECHPIDTVWVPSFTQAKHVNPMIFWRAVSPSPIQPFMNDKNRFHWFRDELQLSNLTRMLLNRLLPLPQTPSLQALGGYTLASHPARSIWSFASQGITFPVAAWGNSQSARCGLLVPYQTYCGWDQFISKYRIIFTLTDWSSRYVLAESWTRISRV